ncbi:MAG TPA: tyrosine-type recombinase/integrase [Pirellulales bacterium]|jgi:integrase
MSKTIKPSRAGRAGKPQKPRADFPLFKHTRGYWCKKVRGKQHSFGRIADDPEGKAALDQWLDQKDELLAGRTPRAKLVDGVTVKDVANHFLTAKKRSLEADELSARTFADYHDTCERVIEAMGKNRLAIDLAAGDFDAYREKLAKAWGPVRLGNEVQRVRTLFKHAFEADLIERPIKFGPAFKKPSRKVMRLSRAQKGERLFEVAQLRKLLADASPQVKAMILLAINAGLGNSDCGQLEFRHLDLKAGWLDYPRPKTGIKRRAPLWPETVKALTAAIKERPDPKNRIHEDLVFVTKYGQPWTKDGPDSPITKEVDKLLVAAKMKRPGLSFYAIRQTFATIAGECRDQPAVNFVMGHADESMAAAYRERIGDDRLQAVVDHVHAWLFPPKKVKKAVK